MKKRVISMVLVLAILIGILPTAALAADEATAAHPFTDVKAGAWYEEYVTYVWENGLFNGVADTSFAPGDTMTRSMFVTVLGRIAGVDQDEYTDRVFEDADPDAWYGPYVAWAAENGITLGTGEGLFSPDVPVTREEIATFVMRYLALIGYDTGEGAELSYADQDEIADYAREAAEICLALGLMEGDDRNCFRPKDDTTRMEAAAICTRLHQLLNPEEEPDDEPTIVWPSDDGSDPIAIYYKVSFENPADEEFAADVLPENTLAEVGSLVYSMLLPEREGYVFCGWFYDSELTRLAATTDTIVTDVTLYPKMVERTAAEEEEWPVYALNYVLSRDVDPDFTVQVQASSEQQIRDNLKFAAFSEEDGEIEYEIIDEGGGIYTLKPEGGLVAGDTYQIIANDRDLDPEFNEDGSIAEREYILFIYNGEVMPSNVQYYNIIAACEEHSTMRIDNDVIFLPYNQVSGLDLENAALYTMSEEGFEMNDTTDTFVYNGDALSVGDVVAIYDGILNEETCEVDGELAYVKILEINGNTYTYGVPGIHEVLFTALTLPIPLDDASTEEVDGAFFNTDGTITVYNEYLDFSGFADYEELPLDGNTTVEVGDYLALYTGEPGTSDYAYYEITGIQDGGSSAVTIFTVVERDEVAAASVYEVYTGDLGITGEAIAALEAEAKKQAIESGFAMEAAEYLTAVLLSGEDLQEVFAGYDLTNISVRNAATVANDREWFEGGEWSPNVGEDQSLSIEAGAIEAGVGTLMVEVGRVDVHVDSSTSLEEITTMDGLRLELGLTFTVQIGNYMVGTGWSDCISLQVSASFVQEVGFSPYAKITEVKGKTKIFRIPYTKEYRVTAGVDVGTYVGVGATFTVLAADDFDSAFPWVEAIKQLDPNYDPKFPNVDSIAKKIRDMMGDETTFALGNGEESLVSIYRDLLEKEIDYVEILAIRCPGCPIKIPLPYKIGKVVINLELVISAKMAVTIGMAMETKSVRRYEFTAWINIIKFKAGYSTNSIDLETPYTEMNLYIMGNIGLRVGPRISLSIHLMSFGGKKLDLANAGFSVYFGYTVDMYGIYFMHMRVEDGKVTSDSRDVGALESNHGIFLDLDFHLGVLFDIISVDIHALDLTWNILDRKGTPKVFEATQRSHNVQMWNNEPYTLSSELLKMNTLVVKTGQTNRKNASFRDFNVELSNPNFSYDPGTGKITVTDPGNSVNEVCEVRLTYLGGDTLFTTAPITIIVNLTWRKTWPSYSIRFHDTVWQTSDGRWVGGTWWGHWIKEYRFVEGATITGIELPSREVQGYDFLGWYYVDDDLEGVENGALLSDLNNLEGYIMPGSDIDIGPLYKARTDTPYVLNYYIETTAGTGAYELYKSVRREGPTDAYIPAAGLVRRLEEDLSEEERDGLKLRYDLLPKSGDGRIHGYVPIPGDGSGSGDIYLDRNDYSVFYHINNRDYTGASVIQVSGVYGAELTMPPNLADVNIPGWTFVGWMDIDGNPVEIPDTVPSDGGRSGIMIDGTYYIGGTHYFAQWEANYNYYTVNYYVMSVDGEYELVDSQVGSDENPMYGGYTGDYIEISDHLVEIDGAKLSHYTCTTADGVETARIIGVSGSDFENIQHNGQVMNIYYDRDYYRVFWDGADGEILQYYYTGQTIVAPEGLTAEEESGYTIDGWINTVGQTEVYRDGSELVMGTMYKRFKPNYIADNATQYTVIHKRPADWTYNDYSDEDKWETVVGYAETDSVVMTEVRQYDGYVSPEAKQLYINGDGSSTVIYQYSRESYGKTLDFNGGTEVNYARNYYYDLPFNLPMNITREGHEFRGWKLTTEGFYADVDEYDGYVYGDCLTSMKDLTFVAQWEKQQIEYKVEHYLENLDGTFAAPQTYTMSAEFESEVTAEAVDFTGFTPDTTVEGTVLSGTIPADGSLVLKLYYTRNSYDVTWYDYDGTTPLTTTSVKYGATITAPDAAATRTGYTWAGWNIVGIVMDTSDLCFNAKDFGTWTANTYTVTFHANGGEGTMDTQTFTYDVSAPLADNAFTNAGYSFVGWSRSADGNAVYGDQVSVKNLAASGNIDLYAQWDAEAGIAYTVKHYYENLDGGYDCVDENLFGTTDSTVSAEAVWKDGFTFYADSSDNVVSGTVAGDGSLVLKLYYTRNSYDVVWYNYNSTAPLTTTSFKYGETIIAPDAAATRTGYTWSGWNIGSVTMGTSALSFNAKDHGTWTANTYTVTFHANGGEGTMDDQTFTYDVSAALTANAFTNAGYIFAGWSTEADGGVVYGDQADVKNLTASGNVDLYAQWTAGTGTAYTVEYYGEKTDGSGYDLLETRNYTDTTGATVTAAAANMDGFTYDAGNAGNVVSGTVAGDGSLVLKLYYTRNSYDVVWYDYDGTTPLTTTSFKYGETVSAPDAAATRTGYTWDGWNIGSVTMGLSALSFNAKDHGTWTANTYTVTFHANGGEGTMDDQTFTYDVSAALTANAFTNTGYTFTGWSTEPDGSVVYGDGADVMNLAASENIPLYAQWTANTDTRYVVKYYGEKLDGSGYDLLSTDELSGTTGASVSANAADVEGFTYDADNAYNVTSGTIAGDESLVLELYYTRNSYALTLDFNGESMKQVVEGSITSIEIGNQEITLKYGQSLADVLTGITVYGLVQESGWTTDPETGEDVYIEDDVYGEIPFETAFPGYTFKAWTDCPDTMPAEDLTLTAEWTPMAVTVVFYPGTNYATGTAVTKTYAYGDTISIPGAAELGFSYDNYFINGWTYGNWSTSDGSHMVGELVLVDGYYSYFGDSYSVSGGYADWGMDPGTVYVAACWTADSNACTIRFNGNGGSVAGGGSMSDQIVDGSGYFYTPLQKNLFVRDGYRFIGWSTTAAYDPDTSDLYSEDILNCWEGTEITLYAQWEAITE